MVVRSVESMTPEPKLITISSSRSIRRRWLPNRPPRVGWALGLATVLAISTAFMYAARGVMYASAVRWANGLEMDSGIEFLAEKGLLALVALTAGVALWTFFCSRRSEERCGGRGGGAGGLRCRRGVARMGVGSRGV